MAEYKLGRIEGIFADMIWDNVPVTSRRLTELAEERLHWKRTTTYTVLKRLLKTAPWSCSALTSPT